MKRFSILFLLVFAVCKIHAQQNNSGIYLNQEDYTKGKLSFTCSCVSSSDKIRLNHFFSRNYIDVFKDGKKYRLNKDSIFGYRDCDGKDYRFYKELDKEYEIVENKTLVMYVADVPTISSNGKTAQLIHAYYFSTTLNSEIYPLTVLNLKKNFPDNLRFHDLLDVTYGDGTIISIYDSEHNMYKVNFLLTKSLKSQL